MRIALEKSADKSLGLLVHADIADNNYIEGELVNESMRGETENVNAATLVAISVHDAANPDGCQPELLEKDTIVYGHMSGQPLLEDAVREARGRVVAISAHDAANPDGCQPELLEKDTIVYGHMSGQPLLEDAVREARGRVICLMADHGRYDIVARGATRGKLVRANWLDDWGTNGVRSRLVAQQFNWAKRDDATQNTPPLVAARLLLSKASSFGHKVGAEARCLAGWDCSVAYYRALLDEDIVVIPPKDLCPAGFVW